MIETSATARVYVIGDPSTDGPVKIGTTMCLRTRLAAIKRGAVKVPAGVNLAAVEVLYDYPGDRRFERNLHHHYGQHRLEGEWFDLSPHVAHNLVKCYLAEVATVEAVVGRGSACGCHLCRFTYGPNRSPDDRPELVGGGRQLRAAIHAITHARLGVDLGDSHVLLPASHCDIDRALALVR